jgi:hypothetical protein
MSVASSSRSTLRVGTQRTSSPAGPLSAWWIQATSTRRVRIEGKGVVVDDKTTLLLVEELLFEKYFYVGHPYAESYFQFGNAAKRTVFELRPEKMIGWDMREVALPQVPEARVLPDFIKDRLV